MRSQSLLGSQPLAQLKLPASVRSPASTCNTLLRWHRVSPSFVYSSSLHTNRVRSRVVPLSTASARSFANDGYDSSRLKEAQSVQRLKQLINERRISHPGGGQTNQAIVFVVDMLEALARVHTGPNSTTSAVGGRVADQVRLDFEHHMHGLCVTSTLVHHACQTKVSQTSSCCREHSIWPPSR